jgi:hypothetical protein
MPKSKPVEEQDPRAESLVDVPASPAEAPEPVALPDVPESAPAVAVEIVDAKTAPPAATPEDAPEFIVLNYLEWDNEDGVTVGVEPGGVVRDIPKRSQAWLKRDGHIARYDEGNQRHHDLHERWKARQPKPRKGGGK